MKRIFVAFASDDQKYRDFLKGQSLNTNSTFEYVDMSVKDPYDTDWKTKVRTRIRGCDGVVALLSSNSLTAAGQKWEMKCADEEDVPMLGIFISKEDKAVPTEMAGHPCVEWTWPAITAFIDSL